MPNLSHNSYSLHYEKFGQGKEVLLFFHGFGQTNESFRSWYVALADTHTCIGIDLFFHGDSTWNNSASLTPEQIPAVIGNLLEKERIEHFGVVAFSLGARFVFALLAPFHQTIQRVFLIAPDVYRHPAYSMLTSHRVGRWIFKQGLEHAAQLAPLVRLLRRLKLVDPVMQTFVLYYLNNKTYRQQLYETWIGFKHLYLPPTTIATHLNLIPSTPVIVTAPDDPVFPARKAKKLIRNLRRYRLEIIEVPHHKLIAESRAFFSP